VNPLAFKVTIKSPIIAFTGDRLGEGWTGLEHE